MPAKPKRLREVDDYSIAGSNSVYQTRMKNKIAQSKVALNSDTTIAYLSNLERGKHAASLSKYFKLANAAGASPEEYCITLIEELKKLGLDTSVCTFTEIDD